MKKSLRIYTSMHLGGLELTKLTYSRHDDNLLRHRSDRDLETMNSKASTNERQESEQGFSMMTRRRTACSIASIARVLLYSALTFIHCSPVKDTDPVAAPRFEDFSQNPNVPRMYLVRSTLFFK